MKVLIATTIPPWKQGQGTVAWLGNAEAMVEEHGNGFDIEFFCAYEFDGRGMTPHKLVKDRLAVLSERGFKVAEWMFRLDDGADEFTGGNRLFRICTGRNAAHEYAMVHGFDYILFLDSDILPDPRCLPMLTVVDHPVVGGDVGAYGMHGPPVTIEREYEYWVSYEGGERVGIHAVRPAPEGVPLEAHWNTAGFLLLQRKVFTRVAWNYNLDAGNTDDPAFQQNCFDLGFGHTWVRKDLQGLHVEPLVPVEQREADRTYYR